MKSLWKVKDSLNRTSCKVSDVQIVRILGFCLCVSVSVSPCLRLFVSVRCVLCVVVVEEGGGGRGETNRTIFFADSLRSVRWDSWS